MLSDPLALTRRAPRHRDGVPASRLRLDAAGARYEAGRGWSGVVPP